MPYGNAIHLDLLSYKMAGKIEIKKAKESLKQKNGSKNAKGKNIQKDR
jgi:hypothetical protein